MINSSTELENLHVSPPDAKPMLCAVCFSDELPLSELEGYEGLCVACECQKMCDELEAKWNKELIIYEKRTGEKLDFNEFYYECQAGNVAKANLKRLPELKSCYEDAIMDLEFYKNENKQLELNFYGDDNLPF